MRVSANQVCFSAPTLGVKWGESSSWFQPELLKVPEDKLRDGSSSRLSRVTNITSMICAIQAISSCHARRMLAMSSKATDASPMPSVASNTELALAHR